MTTSVCVLLALLLTAASARTNGDPVNTASGAAAAALVSALQERHLEAIAARHPTAAGQCLAALLIPQSELLLVSGSCGDKAVLDYRLARGDYREAYVDLQTTGTAAGRFFVQDMGADGFPALDAEDGGGDVVYENGGAGLVLNRNWKGQKLSESEYRQRAAAADRRYTIALQLLRDAVLNSPASAGDTHHEAAGTSRP